MRTVLNISLLASLHLILYSAVSAQPCPCDPPFAEQEPNDVIPVAQTILFGEPFCGVISAPDDVDYVNLNLLEHTKIRLFVEHEPVMPGCPDDLIPIVDLLAPDNQLIARCGDQSDESTVYETDFKIGPGVYLLRVKSGLGSTGNYQLLLDAGSVVPPPAPELAIQKTAPNTISLYWDADEYLPGELIEIERADSPDGPFIAAGTVPAENGGHSLFMLPFPDSRFFRAHATGSRQVSTDPWTGSRITLSNEEDVDGSPVEGDEMVIDEIEFAVNGDDVIVIGKLLGHDPGVPIQQIVQDNSHAYGAELTLIEDWSGHRLDIYGRTITVNYMTFARDPEAEDVGIIDGRGEDVSTGEILMFGDLAQDLEGDAISYIRFGFDEPDLCCRVKTIAFCGPFGIAPPPAGLPCPCPYAPNQGTCAAGPPCQPCNSCTLRVDQTGTVRRCICSFDPAPFGQPPTQIFCTFKPRWKCKQYECLIFGQDCPVQNCPGPNSFIPGSPTPFGRANCKRFCQ